jgi:hypothetical protein
MSTNATDSQRADGTVRPIVGHLPCPFCGRVAEIISRGYRDHTGRWIEWVSVCCNATRGGCGCAQADTTEAKAWAKWDHRHSEPNTVRVGPKPAAAAVRATLRHQGQEYWIVFMKNAGGQTPAANKETV